MSMLAAARPSATFVPYTLRAKAPVGQLIDRFRQVNVDQAKLRMAEEFGYQGMLQLANHEAAQVRNAASLALGKLQRVEGGPALLTGDDLQPLSKIYHGTDDVSVKELLMWDFGLMARVPAARAALADKVGLDNALALLERAAAAGTNAHLDAAAATFLSTMANDHLYAELIMKMNGLEEVMKFVRRANTQEERTAAAFLLLPLSPALEHAQRVDAAGGTQWLVEQLSSDLQDVPSTAARTVAALAHHTPLRAALLDAGALDAAHRLATSTKQDASLDGASAVLATLTRDAAIAQRYTDAPFNGVATVIQLVDVSMTMTAVTSGVLRKLTPHALSAQVNVCRMLENMVRNSDDLCANLQNNKEVVRVVRSLERSDDNNVANAASTVISLMGLTLMRKIAEGELRAREADEKERREKEAQLKSLTEQQRLEADRARVEEEKRKIEEQKRQMELNLKMKQTELERRRAEEGQKRRQEEEERASKEAEDRLLLEQARLRSQQEMLERESELTQKREENRRKFEEERLKLEAERAELERKRKEREAQLLHDRSEAAARDEERRRLEQDRLKREEEERKRRQEEERRRAEEAELKRLAEEEKKREEAIRREVEAELKHRGEALTDEALERAALEARMREDRERTLRLQQFEAELNAKRKQDDAERARLEAERQRMEAERRELEEMRAKLKEAQLVAERERQVDPQVLALFQELRLERYLPCFAHIMWKDFLQSSDESMQKAGVQAIGPRRKILSAIALRRAEIEDQVHSEDATKQLMRDARAVRDPARQISALARLIDHCERSSKRRRLVLKLEGLEMCVSLITSTRVAEVQSGAIKLLSSLLREQHAKNALAAAGGVEPLVYLCDLKAFLGDTPTLAAILNSLRRFIRRHSDNRRLIREQNIGPALLDIGCASIPRCPRIALELLSVLALENAPVQWSVVRTVTGITRLLGLINHPDLQIRENALRAIGAICSGNARDAQYSVFNNSEAMERIVQYMGSENGPNIQAAAAFALGFICEGEAKIVDALKERGAIRQLVRLLPSNHAGVQFAVATAIRALCRGATRADMQKYFYRVLAIGPLCQLAYSRRVNIKTEALAALSELVFNNLRNQDLVHASIGTAAVVDAIRSSDSALQFFGMAVLYRMTERNIPRRLEYAATNATPLITRLASSGDPQLRDASAFAARSFLMAGAPFTAVVATSAPENPESLFEADRVFNENAVEAK